MAVQARHNNEAEYWRDFLLRYEFHPSETPADTESLAYCRQNAWGKESRQDMATLNGLLSLPHAHTKCDVDRFNESGFIPEGPAKLIANLPVGSIVYVPDGRSGYLVRLVSEVKAGILPQCIARHPRTCGHDYTRSSVNCPACSQSVVAVNHNYQEMLYQGHILEPFYSLYRECDPVGQVSIVDHDLRKFAGANSAGMKQLHWHRVQNPLNYT